MIVPSRFSSPSRHLSLQSLRRRAAHASVLSVCVALFLHGSLTHLGALGLQRRTPRPLTTRFVKRQPRLTKPLELKKRPQPRRREVRRTMVAVKARGERGGRLGAFVPSGVMEGLARPRVAIGRATSLRAGGSCPATRVMAPS